MTFGGFEIITHPGADVMSADDKSAMAMIAQRSASTSASAASATTTTTTVVAPTSEREETGKTSTSRQKNNVRKTRIDKMMSKAELARRANLSVLTIDRIEKGFGCRMDTKRKILEALGLSLADRVRVFGEEE